MRPLVRLLVRPLVRLLVRPLVRLVRPLVRPLVRLVRPLVRLLLWPCLGLVAQAASRLVRALCATGAADDRVYIDRSI